MHNEERDTHPVVRLLAILIGLVFLYVILLSLIFPDRAREYRLYLTESRHALDFSFDDLSDRWTEADLRLYFESEKIRCYEDGFVGKLGNKACVVDVSSHNGVPAMFVSFFFADNKLNSAIVALPWWVHGQMLETLANDYGAPAGLQEKPVNDVRLIGWSLQNGGGLFINRERDHNPLFWNVLLWASPRLCGFSGCFSEDQQPNFTLPVTL